MVAKKSLERSWSKAQEQALLGNLLWHERTLKARKPRGGRGGSVVAVDPLHANAHSNLGVLLHHEGSAESLREAEEEYRAAIKAQEQHTHALANLGVLLEGRAQRHEAENEQQQAPVLYEQAAGYWKASKGKGHVWVLSARKNAGG